LLVQVLRTHGIRNRTAQRFHLADAQGLKDREDCAIAVEELTISLWTTLRQERRSNQNKRVLAQMSRVLPQILPTSIRVGFVLYSRDTECAPEYRQIQGSSLPVA
jgi:hypothetical protein